MAYKGLKVSSAVINSRKPSWTHQSSSARLDTMALLCCQNTGANFYCMHHVMLTCALPAYTLSYSSSHPACPGQFLARSFCLWKYFPSEWPNIYQFKPGLACKHEDWGQGNVVHFLLSSAYILHTKTQCFMIFFPQPLMWLSPPKPQGLERTIMALGVLSSLIFSLHPSWPVFIVKEMPDFT